MAVVGSTFLLEADRSLRLEDSLADIVVGNLVGILAGTLVDILAVVHIAAAGLLARHHLMYHLPDMGSSGFHTVLVMLCLRCRLVEGKMEEDH